MGSGLHVVSHTRYRIADNFRGSKYSWLLQVNVVKVASFVVKYRERSTAACISRGRSNLNSYRLHLAQGQVGEQIDIRLHTLRLLEKFFEP